MTNLNEIEIPSIAHDGSISADWLAMTLAEDAWIENGRLENAPYLAVKIATVSDEILARAVKAERERDEARAALAPKADWADREDDHTLAIQAAWKDGKTLPHYATSAEMVGNRHSKGALIHLTAWLLSRVAEAEAERDEMHDRYYDAEGRGDDARADVARLRAALEWQPIETAPKDGTPMMLFYQTLGVRYGHWDHIGTADWWIADVNGDDPSGWACPYQEDDLDPTHWRPLPPPPESKP